MKCDEVRELLHPFLDGELDAEAEATVRAELADCAECQAELKEIETVSAFARAAFTDPIYWIGCCRGWATS